MRIELNRCSFTDCDAECDRIRILIEWGDIEAATNCENATGSYCYVTQDICIDAFERAHQTAENPSECICHANNGNGERCRLRFHAAFDGTIFHIEEWHKESHHCQKATNREQHE